MFGTKLCIQVDTDSHTLDLAYATRQLVQLFVQLAVVGAFCKRGDKLRKSEKSRTFQLVFYLGQAV